MIRKPKWVPTLLAVIPLVAFDAAPGQTTELAAYEIEHEISIPKPLTAEAGDPVRGRAVAINRKKGNCLACHVLPIPE